MPLVDRVSYLWFLRLALALLPVTLRGMAPKTMTGAPSTLAMVALAYMSTSVLLQWAWRMLCRRHRGLVLVGVMLLVDGVYLTAVSYLTGGGSSPVRYLFVLHLIGVALLASYRTGVKMAAWDSLLLLAVPSLEDAHVLNRLGGSAGSEQQQVIVLVGMCWLAILVAAAFSAVNERELRRRRRDLDTLALMAAELELVNDPIGVAGTALGRVVTGFGFDRAMLLAGRTEGALAVVASHGVDVKVGTACAIGSGSVIERALEGRCTLLESGIDSDRDAWLASALPAASNLIVTPLSAQASPFGVLVLEHASRGTSGVDERVVAMVERFASHAALAIRNAWLLEQVTRSASTDGLTGLANRRSFDVALSRELSRAARSSESVSLVMLDVDGFKMLNDRHGHQTGDEVLRRVAGVLAGNSREFDTAARYGGEEFAVILPSCHAAQAVEIADRLRRLIAAVDTPVPVTVSAGVATFPVHAPDAVSLIGAADMALYDSKHGGRNRVTGAMPSATPAKAAPPAVPALAPAAAAPARAEALSGL